MGGAQTYTEQWQGLCITLVYSVPHLMAICVMVLGWLLDLLSTAAYGS